MRVPRKKITQLVIFVARSQAADVEEVDIAVVSSKQITAMNRRYLGKSTSTDVLSFDLSESPAAPLRAQIVVCGEKAVTEARKRNLSPQRELMLYVVHGLLHLLGYDDTTAAQAAKMHAREQQLLSCF